TGSEPLVIGSHQAGADVWRLLGSSRKPLLSSSQGVEDLSLHCNGERRCRMSRSGGEKPRERGSGGTGGSGGSTGSITSRSASGGLGGKQGGTDAPATGRS
ncbi:unnamed protein product, partial [Brassica rapa subsp. narinosa]